MPRIKYADRRFSGTSLKLIEHANRIIEEYQSQGYDLTLRQLYYQFVSRDIIANKDAEYKRIGSIINDARLAGLVDWESITDRTRNLRKNSHWDNPRDILYSAAEGFAVDRWKNQDFRPEVWIEKDALLGILDAACDPLDVPYFSCRGYTSVSEVWVAAQRMKKWEENGQTPIVFHLGDHDPSGIDMSRDVKDRLNLFGVSPEFRRIALNWDQIQEYGPPPNPAKATDARFLGYQKKFGDQSWELDALNPTVLAELIRDQIASVRDEEKWGESEEEQEDGKTKLRRVYKDWDKITDGKPE